MGAQPDPTAQDLAMNVRLLHMVGDTGGINNSGPQHRVAAAMTADITCSAGSTDGVVRLALYIPGDVVYFYGEAEHY